jgi:hypothetical protein
MGSTVARTPETKIQQQQHQPPPDQQQQQQQQCQRSMQPIAASMLNGWSYYPLSPSTIINPTITLATTICIQQCLLHLLCLIWEYQYSLSYNQCTSSNNIDSIITALTTNSSSNSNDSSNSTSCQQCWLTQQLPLNATIHTKLAKLRRPQHYSLRGQLCHPVA